MNRREHLPNEHNLSTIYYFINIHEQFSVSRLEVSLYSQTKTSSRFAQILMFSSSRSCVVYFNMIFLPYGESRYGENTQHNITQRNITHHTQTNTHNVRLRHYWPNDSCDKRQFSKAWEWLCLSSVHPVFLVCVTLILWIVLISEMFLVENDELWSVVRT